MTDAFLISTGVELDGLADTDRIRLRVREGARDAIVQASEAVEEPDDVDDDLGENEDD